MMRSSHAVGRVASILALLGATTAVATMAGAASSSAATPVGSCTNSYTAYTYSELAFDPDAQAIFSVIDANGDGIICFKPYPNGPHNSHLGNLVDDKAAPHS